MGDQGLSCSTELLHDPRLQLHIATFCHRGASSPGHGNTIGLERARRKRDVVGT